jgi:hypothetical protein
LSTSIKVYCGGFRSKQAGIGTWRSCHVHVHGSMLQDAFREISITWGGPGRKLVSAFSNFLL